MVKQQCGSVWGRQAKATTTGTTSTWSTQPVQNRVRDFGYESVKCTRPLPRSAWHPPPLQVKQQNHQVQVPFGGGSGSRPVSQGGSGVTKRGCAGTGVFLPRQYGAPPPESRKKTSKNYYPLVDFLMGCVCFLLMFFPVVLLQVVHPFWSQRR